MDALSDNDKLILESAKSIREDFLYQSAFDPVDTYASGKKQYLMLKTIITFYREAKNALEQGKQLEKIILIPSRKEIPQMRFTKEQELQKIQELQNRIIEEIRNV
jgi:V/A-type H+-transporting ATPase subunit A